MGYFAEFKLSKEKHFSNDILKQEIQRKIDVIIEANETKEALEGVRMKEVY